MRFRFIYVKETDPDDKLGKRPLPFGFCFEALNASVATLTGEKFAQQLGVQMLTVRQARKGE